MTGDERLAAQAAAIAARLLEQSNRAGPGPARRRERRLRQVLGTDEGTRLVFALADRVLRPVSPRPAARQLAVVAARPPDRVLGAVDRRLLGLAARTGTAVPGLVVTAVAARLNLETRRLIWPTAPRPLGRRLRNLREAGARANLNLLGEAILGESEAARRVRATEGLLERPDVDAVSVKVSSVAPSLSLLDEDGSVERAARALRRVYRAAGRAPRRPLVTLDMEEHRDLDVTVAAFRRVLDEPEFEAASGGIALQAYLPDTHAVLAELLEWSAHRHRRAGGTIRVRLVKGANLAMERLDAELRGWPLPCYRTKADSDASYLRLLDGLLRPEHARHVQVGVATHNLFDVGVALAWSAERGVAHRVEIEMLAGMADRQAAAVAAETGRLLVYVPVTDRGDYRKALAYLARRLDENATPEGFLQHALELSVGNPAWGEQRRRFEASLAARHRVRTGPFQEQDRVGGLAPSPPAPARPAPGRPSEWANEPDTDLTVRANRAWARKVLAAGARATAPAEGTVSDVDEAVAIAAAAARRWASSSPGERRHLLHAVAASLRARRGEAAATMAAEAGKTFAEADPEVSEAVDYATWYAEGTRLFDEVANEAVPEPLGVVAVIPPWNFPLAIPAGGVLATLAAGGAAILKPSPQTPRTAAVLHAALLDAGVPGDLVQLVAAPDGLAGRRLVEHPDVGTVILTGSWETARRFQRWRPGLRLLGETSGKNAVVVSATADVDQAVAELVRSAFGHAGQKCSAASLAIVDDSVHDRSPFLRQLADAVRSLRVGPATEPRTEMGPLVGPGTKALTRALTRLDPGESWLVEPRLVDPGARLWSPGVRLGVVPGSWAHTTEWFGPVLGVMRSRCLAEAVEWQNAVPYGLTAGLCSTDPAEQDGWVAAVEAGNLYVNRTTTGAIVGRQPFGGWKRSAWGPTAKTGGPDYLAALSRWRDAGGGTASYDQVAAALLAPVEMAGLQAESNLLTRHPLPGVLLRVGEDVGEDQVERARWAAAAVGTPIEISRASSEPAPVDRLHPDHRLRILGSPEPPLLAAAADAGVPVLAAPVIGCGRVELPRWLRERSVSRSRHRYGNIVG